MRSMRLLAQLSVLFLSMVAASAMAQYPTKAVRLVVAFPPGASTDVSARIVAQKLSETLGQSVVVENRAGAGGNIGTQVVAKSPADGYTLLVTSVAYAVNQSLYSNPGYTNKDFIPVIKLNDTPNILFVHTSVPVSNLKELVAYSKTTPLSYASSGNGTTTHLSMEVLKKLAGMEIQHVPFTPAAAVTAVLGNQVPVGSTSMPPTVQHIKAGKIKPLAVTSLKRSAALPDVPTVAEQGFPGFEDSTWVGLFAPAGTPADIVNKLNAEINKALESDDVKAKFAQAGFEFKRNTPAEFAASINADIPKYARAVKDSGARAD